MRSTSLLVSLFCVFFVYGLTNQATAQHAIGVKWEIPEDHEKAAKQLESLRRLNISHLHINEQPSDSIWEQINRLNFTVFAEIPVSFPTVQTFAVADSSILARIQDAITAYSSQSSVRAIGLFRHGAAYKQAMEATIRPLLERIESTYSGELYYTSSRNEEAPIDSLFDFKILDSRIRGHSIDMPGDSLSNNVGAIVYHPEEDLRGSLQLFKSFLQEISAYPIPVFVDSKWLFKMIEEHSGFKNTIQLYNSGTDYIFPTPKESKLNSRNHSLVVLLLVLIWGIFAVNYHMSPVYRKSLSRYFLGHTFFVEDVMDRHIRAVSPVMTVLIQNALLSGICGYSLGHALFTPLGLEAIFYHYPSLWIFKSPLLSFFIWGCLAGGLLTVLSITWIRIANREIIRFRQILNLYAWPFQINFVLGTLMVTLIMAGSYPLAILSLAALFVVILISAFIVTALDVSKYHASRRFVLVTVNIGVYCLLWIGLAIWIFNTSLIQVLQLAASLG